MTDKTQNLLVPGDTALQPVLDALVAEMNRKFPGGRQVDWVPDIEFKEFLVVDYMGSELGSLLTLFHQILRYSFSHKGSLYWRCLPETVTDSNGCTRAYARLIITEQVITPAMEQRLL